jgi:hypothetical protein
MSAIRGTIQDGKVILDTPANWPNGKRVFVVDPEGDDGLVMLSEEEQGTDPESIARWLAWYDALEPLVMTPEDEEQIRKAREEQKAFELAKWEERSKKLEKLFE